MPSKEERCRITDLPKTMLIPPIVWRRLGVVFAGALDRVFAAHDDTTGKELWRARLGDVPSNAPISCLANGKQ